jgi:hypothetical protein
MAKNGRQLPATSRGGLAVWQEEAQIQKMDYEILKRTPFFETKDFLVKPKLFSVIPNAEK